MITLGENRHRFLRDHIQKGDSTTEYIDTMHQLANIFTNALPKDRFYDLRHDLGVLDMS